VGDVAGSAFGADAGDEGWVELRSSIVVRLGSDGVPIGTVNLYHPAEGYFVDRDSHLLETIAEQAAMAMAAEMAADRAA
jgi:GAF domain-containing protein